MGEYSDRCDWIGGVFDNKETAQNMIINKAAEARQHRMDYNAWLKKRWAICKRLSGNDSIWKLSGDQLDALNAESGEAPTGQNGDTFYLVEVPFNQWGEFSIVGSIETRTDDAPTDPPAPPPHT